MPFYSIDGLRPVVDASAFVHATAVLIGDVWIGPGCYVGPLASLRGDFGRIVLHAGSNVQDSCVMHAFPGQDTVVEADGHVGHGSVLHGCTVRRDALVGMNAVVMDGVEIGEQAIIAACAFIREGFKVPPRVLVAGVPGKVVRELKQDELAWKREATATYQMLSRRCVNSLREVEPLSHADPARERLSVDDINPALKTLAAHKRGE